tara:strand:- start:2153 stop:3547 length:1395 start_codon:yes stop_codon:yes gene_type:complete
MFSVVDFIKNIVESLEFTEAISNLTSNPTESQFDTCNTHHATTGNYIVIDGQEYKVKDFEINLWISVVGMIPITATHYTIPAPNFFNGTPMQVQNVLANIREWRDKLPMVYLLEVIREQRFNSRTNKLDRISDLRLFLLMSSNFQDWDVAQHYDLAIQPMDNFLNDLISNLRLNNNVGEFDDYETINRANFGVWVSKKTKSKGKYEDNITKLIDENVSGVELKINLPIKKNPCFTFNTCIIQPSIPFANTLSTSFDGFDEEVDGGNPFGIQLTGNISFSIFIKTTFGGTGIIVTKRNPATNFGYQFYSSGGKLRLLVNFLGGIKTIVGTTSIDDGNWHHVLCTISQGVQISMILDGSTEGTESIVGETYVESNSNLKMGGGQVGASFYYWEGLTNNFSLYNRLVSSSEVRTATNQAKDISSTAPVLWWRCGNGDTYPILTDNSINAHIGQMINMESIDFVNDAP